MSNSSMLDKLYYLEVTKEEIRNALIDKGLEVPNDLTFREYANLIRNIGSESGLINTKLLERIMLEDIKINNINTSDNVLIEIKEYTGGSN